MKHTVDEALSRFDLVAGIGSEKSNKACAMTLLAWVAGQPWTDAPACAHTLIRNVTIWVNDSDGTTPHMREQIVRAGQHGILDTWWVPNEVVVLAFALESAGEQISAYERLLRALARIASWKEAKGLPPNLTGAYLTGAYLRGATLRGADLTGADLTNANLTGAYLTGAYLRGATLRGADLTGADLTNANLTNADLRGATLRGADLTGATLTNANLTNADLRGADLTGATLRGADLTNATLTGANLTNADLTNATLTNAYLRYATLTGANLTNADLTGALGMPKRGWPKG